MSNNSVTTTMKGFRVEDITFRGARRQCEIEKEIEHEEEEEVEVKAPVSLTPEKVKSFLKQKISVAKDSNEKRVYSQTIRWIDELSETRKKLFSLEARYEVKEADENVNEE